MYKYANNCGLDHVLIIIYNGQELLCGQSSRASFRTDHHQRDGPNEEQKDRSIQPKEQAEMIFFKYVKVISDIVIKSN